MPPTAPFLELKVDWNDDDLQEVVVAASSGRFAGQVNLYGDPHELARVAESLVGFPVSPTDRREIQLGRGDLPGYGTANLTVYCTNSTGQVAVEVAMRTFPASSSERQESAVVVVPAVIGDIDRFVQQLRRANNQVGAHASLLSAA